MLEVAHAGEEHGHAVFVSGGDGFLVSDGAAGLDDGGDAGSGRGVNAVSEGEESVGGHDAARDGLPGLHDADLGGIDAAHLTGADAHEFGALGVNDGVRFDVLAALPGKEEGFYFLFRGLALGDALQAHLVNKLHLYNALFGKEIGILSSITTEHLLSFPTLVHDLNPVVGIITLLGFLDVGPVEHLHILTIVANEEHRQRSGIILFDDAVDDSFERVLGISRSRLPLVLASHHHRHHANGYKH